MLLEGKKAIVTAHPRHRLCHCGNVPQNGASVALFGSRQETVDKALARSRPKTRIGTSSAWRPT